MESNQQKQTKLVSSFERNAQVLSIYSQKAFRNLWRIQRAPSKLGGKKGSGDAQGIYLIVSPYTKLTLVLTNVRKSRHLNYEKTSVDKQVSTVELLIKAAKYFTPKLKILTS